MLYLQCKAKMLYGEKDEFREKFVFGKSFRFVCSAAFNNSKAGDGRLSFKRFDNN